MGEIKVQVQASKTQSLEVGTLNVKNKVDIEENPTHYYSTLAKQWAVFMDGKVQSEDYSSKYYANVSKNNADITENNRIVCENINTSMNNNYQNYLNDIAEKQTEINENIDKKYNETVEDIKAEANTQISNIQQTGFYMRDGQLYYIDENGEEQEFIQNGSGLPIGSVYPLICTGDYVPDGSLACDGSEYSKSQFLQLWENYLTGETPLLKTCTYEDYTSMVTTYGSCPMFGIDEERLKFKVPFIKDGTFIQQAQTDTELGKAYTAGLPEIEGSFKARGFYENIDLLLEPTTGAFSYTTEANPAYSIPGTDLNPGVRKVNFKSSDSNAIYGNSVTVQPESVALRYFVVVSTGTINEAQMDWSEWASSIQSKADTDLSNLSEAGQAILDAKADADELDGVWVKKHKELLINVSCNGTSDLNIDLSNYLPSDGNAYEIILSSWVTCDNIALHPVECQVNSSLSAVIVAHINTTLNQGLTVGSGLTFPVGPDKIIKLRRRNNTFGTVNLNVDAYRKVRS